MLAGESFIVETEVNSSITPDIEKDKTWYVFYSENQKREYYYNPFNQISSWVLPVGAHRCTDPRMVDTNPGFTPLYSACRHSLEELFDSDSDEEDSVQSETGVWKEKSVIKANLIVQGIFFIGLLLAASCSAVAKIAYMNSANPRIVLEETKVTESGIITKVHNFRESESVASSERFTRSRKYKPYHKRWWNFVTGPPRALELEQLMQDLESSFEAAEFMLSKIMTDAEHAGIDLGSTQTSDSLS